MKPWVRHALQLISVILFIGILWWARPSVWQQLLQGDLQDLLWFFGMYAIAGVVSATRLRLITHSITGQPWASWRQYFTLNWTARALGLVLPRSISGVGGKTVGLRAFGMPIKVSIWVVLVDNLFDVLLLATVAIPSVLFFQGSLNGRSLFAGMLAFSMLLAGAIWWGTKTDRLWSLMQRIPFLQKRLPDTLSGRFLPAAPQALQAVGYSLLLNLVLAISFFVMGHAVGLSLPLPLVIAAYPIVQLSLVAAVTPGGLGLFELGWIGLLLLGGISRTDAVTFSIAQRAYIFVNVLLWTGISLLVSLTERRQRIR